MKKTFALATMAATLLCAFPIHADEKPATVAPIAVKPQAAPSNLTKNLPDSAMWQVFEAVTTELRSLRPQHLPASALVSKYNAFDFSPSTKQKLFKVFGTEKPVHIDAKLRADGKIDLSVLVDALNYADPVMNSTFQWAPITSNSSFDDSFRQVDITANMPWFSIADKGGLTVRADDISYQGAQSVSTHGGWLGKASVKIATIDVSDATNAVHGAAKDFTATFDIQQREKFVDIDYQLALQSVKWDKDEIGPIRFGIKLNNLDELTMSNLKKDMEKLETRKLPDAKRNAEVMAAMKKAGSKIITPLSSLDIQELSVVYHGFKALVTGKVSLNNTKQADFSSFEKLKDKLVAHFDMEMPMGLAEEISKLVARRSLEQKAEKGQVVSEDAVNQTANLLLTQTIENLRAQKMIVVDDQTLRSKIDFADGKLLVNGNPVFSPSPKASTKK
ncbi:uncharacterized protein YdgA (DUF945 family) [Undibacterium sp. GrIS 1.8]